MWLIFYLIGEGLYVNIFVNCWVRKDWILLILDFVGVVLYCFYWIDFFYIFFFGFEKIGIIF